MWLPDTAGPTCLFRKSSQVAAVWLQLTHTLKPGLCPTLYLTHQSQTTSFATQLHKANLHTVSHIENMVTGLMKRIKVPHSGSPTMSGRYGCSE